MSVQHLLIAVLLVAAGTVHAAESDKWPLVLPAPHGAVILPNENAKRAHDEFRYAAVRRVDNMLYVSGVVIGRRPDEGKDPAAFKIQVRRGLQRLQSSLAAAGASFQDVVMVNSFHVWEGPNFSGTRDEQFDAFEEVIGEFLKPPYPAWTAVGTSGLLADGGIVEVHVEPRDHLVQRHGWVLLPVPRLPADRWRGHVRPVEPAVRTALNNPAPASPDCLRPVLLCLLAASQARPTGRAGGSCE